MSATFPVGADMRLFIGLILDFYIPLIPKR